jgi:hypothetical protein
MFVVLEDGQSYSVEDLLHVRHKYHNIALISIHYETPNMKSDVTLIRPQTSNFEFCQENLDYKWSEVRFFWFNIGEGLLIHTSVKLDRVYFISQCSWRGCSLHPICSWIEFMSYPR